MADPLISKQQVKDALKRFRETGDSRWALASEVIGEEAVKAIVDEAVAEAVEEAAPSGLDDDDMRDIFDAL
jgi:hypothetical protein